MPKLRRALSLFLALWLCVMLITFTYTWVSRNWTPSIEGDKISIASSGALVISLLPDGTDSRQEVLLNQIVGWDSFTFRQVSSQDGINFFWKDFSNDATGKVPSQFIKIANNEDAHKRDYIDTKFYLKYDESMPDGKYIFIHPESIINSIITTPDLKRAIRISLTFDVPEQVEPKTVILAQLDGKGGMSDDYEEEFTGVAPDANYKYDDDPTATGKQTCYDLQYFDCGRSAQGVYDENDYNYTPDPSRALFRLNPGETKCVYMRIWLEGEDANCLQDIAGEDFSLVLKFDSISVKAGQNNP